MLISIEKTDKKLTNNPRIAGMVQKAMKEPVGLRVKALRERLDGNFAREIDADAQYAGATYRFGDKIRKISMVGNAAGVWYYYEMMDMGDAR